MATQVQRRRGTTAQHAAFSGQLAELTVDTDKLTVVVQDGSTLGGHPLAKEAALTAHTTDTTDAHAASAITNTPAGTITATTVQAAINELDGDIVAHVGDTVDAHDASAISIVDTGTYFTGTNVEAALQELGAAAGTSGSASPTATAGANVSSVGTPVILYSVVGNSVVFNGHVTVNYTASNVDSVFYIGLPYGSSNFTSVNDAQGVVVRGNAAGSTSGILNADSTNDRLAFFIYSGAGGLSFDAFFSGSYRLL